MNSYDDAFNNKGFLGRDMTSNSPAKLPIDEIYRMPWLFLSDEGKYGMNNIYRHQMKLTLPNIDMNSDFANYFFSRKNIDTVQQLLKDAVYDTFNGKYKLVADQEVTVLQRHMESIYRKYATLLLVDSENGIKRLNKLVIDEILPGVIINIQMNMKYLQDIKNRPELLPLPTNESNAGRNTLPSIFH